MEPVSFSELKPILLDMMSSVHTYCEENGLTYYMWGGTLLGAVRHHGFIPWDDDIDIAMPRKDYEYFTSHFQTEDYSVYSCESNNKYPYVFAKAFDKRTVKIEPIKYRRNFQIGIEIDIFPLDELNSKSDADRYENKRSRLLKLWSYSIMQYKERLTVGNVLKNCIIFVLNIFTNYICRRVNRLTAHYHSAASSLIILSSDSNLKKTLMFNKDWYKTRLLLPFEEYRFYAPVNYKEVLTQCYGDYMTPPPPEKQVTHHSFKIYRKEC